MRGEVIAATRDEHLEDWGRDLLSGAAVHDRAGILSPLRRSVDLGRPTLLVLQPIQGGGDRTIGFFVERLTS